MKCARVVIIIILKKYELVIHILLSHIYLFKFYLCTTTKNEKRESERNKQNEKISCDLIVGDLCTFVQ